MNDEEKDHEEAVFRRRFDEWTFKGVTLLFPLVIAIGGWAFALQGKIREIETQLDERSPRIAAAERSLATLSEAVRDPSPKPETKVEIAAIKLDIERLDERVTRLEERVNNLHNYMLALPVRPSPYAIPAQKRGDIKLEDFIRGATPSRLN